MSSAWGSSWASAWGNAWGSIAAATTDTHDGFDEDSHREAKKAEREQSERFKSARSRLRAVLERAWGEPEPGPVAAEVKTLAAPYVERLESGALRVDYKGLASSRNAAVMAQVLAFQDSLRTEFEARMALENDDEDVMIVASQWN